MLNQQFRAPDLVELEVGISRAGGQIEQQRLILRQIEEEWKLDVLATAALSDPSSFQAQKTVVEPDGTETTEPLNVILEQSTEARLVPDNPPQRMGTGTVLDGKTDGGQPGRGVSMCGTDPFAQVFDGIYCL